MHLNVNIILKPGNWLNQFLKDYTLKSILVFCLCFMKKWTFDLTEIVLKK